MKNCKKMNNIFDMMKDVLDLTKKNEVEDD